MRAHRSPRARQIAVAVLGASLGPFGVCGLAQAAEVARGEPSCPAERAPLSGVVTAQGLPASGATLVVRGLAAGVEIARTIRVEPDGTFVWPDACPGLYTVVAAAPGSLPAVTHLMHRAARDVASFVRLELPLGGPTRAAREPRGFLPRTLLGSADPWVARAVVLGDALRDEEPVLVTDAASADPAVWPRPALTSASAAEISPAFRASLASMAAFGSETDMSRIRLGLSGRVGPKVRWGLEGQYSRMVSANGELTGDGTSLAVDVEPGDRHAIRVSSRLTRLPAEDSHSRYSAHAVDWRTTSPVSQASLSARVISQSNLGQVGPLASLFARSQDTVEVHGRYRRDLSSGTYLRVAVGYRSASEAEGLDAVGHRDQRAEVGGTAGVRLLSILRVEAGATGDLSPNARGVTPELTIALEPTSGLSFYGFASQRFEEQLIGGVYVRGRTGTDEADLEPLTRSLYRAGLRFEPEGPVTVLVEASRREIGGVYRYLIDPEFLDRLDSLYFFTGDVAHELTYQASVRLAPGVSARMGGRVGRVTGARTDVLSRDEARYGIASANVHIPATGTLVSLGYRVVVQSLSPAAAMDRPGSLGAGAPGAPANQSGGMGFAPAAPTPYRNNLTAVDVSLAQPLPLPLLKGLGSELRALLSLELGRRVQGDVVADSQRWAGGLALSF